MTTTAPPGRPRSTEVTEGPTRAPARSMLRAVGFTDDDFQRPQVGVASPMAAWMRSRSAA